MDELQAAWEAIQDGDLQQAARLAAALAKNEPDNADAWYLLSEAVEGERQALFRKKALALDPRVADRYREEAAAEMAETDAGLMDEEPEAAELPTEFFAYPDNRPEVEMPEAAAAAEPAVTAAPAAAPTPPRRRRRARQNSGANLALILVGLLILIVLYFFITSLL